MKNYLAVIALALGIILNQTTEAKEAPREENPDEIISKIQTTYEKLKDLQASFIQTVVFKDFDTPFVSEGKLFLKKGKMRWDYQRPSLQQIFVDGEKVLYYVPEHKQAIRSRIGGESDSHLPLQLLSGTGRLDQTFKTSVQGGALSQKEVTLRLVPKEKKSTLTQIIATVIPFPSIEGWIIQKVVLYEENGNVSTFSFNGIEMNKEIPDTFFEFKVPKGVEVIESP